MNVSDHASDPEAWAKLAGTIGVGGLFGVLILLICAAAAVLIYRATIGQSGFVRTIFADIHARSVAFLDELKASLNRLETATTVGRQNSLDLRQAGREFAAGMAAIGHEIGADVSQPVARIEAVLQRKDD